MSAWQLRDTVRAEIAKLVERDTHALQTGIGLTLDQMRLSQGRLLALNDCTTILDESFKDLHG
jgi:hypothetical protein